MTPRAEPAEPAEPTEPTELGALAVRRATEADWPQLWPIFHEVTAAGDTFAYDPDTDEHTARSWWLGPPPNQTWVAVDRDGVLGMYIVGPNRGGPGAHIGTASYMVAAAARGRGIGRRLVEHSLGQAREAGYLGVQFNAVAASNVYAVKLYEDLGFTTIGIVPQGFRHPEQGLVDLLIMYYEL